MSSPLSSRAQNYYWFTIMALVISTSLIAGCFWSTEHLNGAGWDEALYINQSYKDISSFEKGGVRGLIKSIFFLDRETPPAYRLLAFPLILIIGVNPGALRLLSLFFLGISLFFVYLCAKHLAGPLAGAFAATFLAICPIIIGSSMYYGTEYPLYFAVSATLYFLFLNLSREQTQSEKQSWLSLGFILGIGGLAKSPFVLIVSPVMLFVVILVKCRVIAKPSFIFLLKSLFCAVVIALPWWIYNFQSAIGRTLHAGGYKRHSLGPKDSFETWVKWLELLNLSVFGPPLCFLIIAFVLYFFIKLVFGQIQMNLTQKIAVCLCLSSAIPLVVLSSMGENQNPRLLSPSLIPLAVAIGIIAVTSQWTSSRCLIMITTVVFCVQLSVMVTPLLKSFDYGLNNLSPNLVGPTLAKIMQKPEQWDWSKLREICNRRRIIKPSISYLGNASTFNPPQISYPWIKVNEDVHVTWLWRYEQGEINWNKVMESVNSSDVVLTAPGFMGDQLDDKQNLDNQHNTELVQRLQKDSRFIKPLKLRMGRFNSVQILVFLKQ